SAARVIVDHYKTPKFDRYAELMEATDRLDSAQLNMDDVVAPKGWILVGYTLDPRTGLGAFKDYFLHLMQLAKTKTIDQIVADPQVKERIERVKTEEAQFKEHVKADSRQD